MKCQKEGEYRTKYLYRSSPDEQVECIEKVKHMEALDVQVLIHIWMINLDIEHNMMKRQ